MSRIRSVTTTPATQW